MSTKSDLPFGSEFSPSQIELPVLLGLAETHGKDTAALERAIRRRFFSTHGGGSDPNQKKLAMNCRLGMKAYGILHEDGGLTEFGSRLARSKGDAPALYGMLARHILLNLRGMELIQCVRDMTAAGEAITLVSLRSGLATRGIHFPPGGKHPSMMRLWLAEAGIFAPKGWLINEARLAEALGTNSARFSALTSLTEPQRVFLLALANSGTDQPQPANRITKLATATYGIGFPEKSLAREVLEPLVQAGFIRVAKATTGRGAKPFMVAPTNAVAKTVVTPILEGLKRRADPKLLALLRKPLASVMEDLTSGDRHIAGLALEGLAFKLMRMLDMDYVATRLRAAATGGAEVDLVFESAHLVFARWQVQCKNTKRIELDDVAKEVGLTHFLKSNAIIMVGTGAIGREARRFANRIMAESNLCVVMLDGADLAAIRDNPSHLVDAFVREAKHAMDLKKLDLRKGG
jgi:site-specific DNA-methyltransferase (cytosine-N4-specific)